MTVGFMRWLQRQHNPGRRSHRRYDWERCNRAAALRFTLFRGELATATLQSNTNNNHPANVLRTTCACVGPRRRDRLKGTPSRRKTGRKASTQTHRGRDA